MKHFRHPATIIAAVALFLALGGGATAYATGLISGSQIKDHSIAEKKLTKKAIKALRGQRGPAGPKGATGATGAQGVQGAQGVPGPDFERLVAQTNTSQTGHFVDFSTLPTINTVTFTAPSAGFITISGQTFINDETTAGVYFLEPTLDSADIMTASPHFATAHTSAGGELFTLNFTLTIPVSTGSHTVADILHGPSGSQFYNVNDLTVLFAPSGGVTSLASHASAHASDPLGR